MNLYARALFTAIAGLAVMSPANGQFSPSPNSPFFSGHSPVALVAADFNGDGIPDLAVANQADSTVTILLGDGKGNFSPPATGPSMDGVFPVAPGMNPSGIVAADFNGDGKMDLAVSNVNSNNITILFGDGTGGISSSNTVGTGNGPTAIVTADFNNDTKPDLATANLDDGTVTILYNDGSGGFGNPITLNVGKDPVALVAADLNADGTPDLAVANEGDGKVYVFLDPSPKNETPEILTSTVIPTRGTVTQSISAITAGNFTGHPVSGNSPSYLDLAVTYYDDTSYNGNLLLFISDEQGNYHAPLSGYFASSFGSQPVAIATGFFSPGLNPGVAIANYRSGTVAVYAGNGTAPGTFTATANSPYKTGSLPRALAVADFNGDGLSDIAVANYFDGTVTVLLNSFGTAPVMLSAASATAPVAPGSLVTIYGTGLSPSANPNATSLKLTDASGIIFTSLPLLYASPTQINTTIPPAAATGLASFTVTTPQGAPQKGSIMIMTVAPGLFSADATGKGAAVGYVVNLLTPGAQPPPLFVCSAPFVCSPNPFDVSSGLVSVVLYGTGIRNRSQLSSVAVTVGGVPVPVFYAGPAGTDPGSGLDQVNISLPATLVHAGTVFIQLSIGAAMANQVTVAIQ